MAGRTEPRKILLNPKKDSLEELMTKAETKLGIQVKKLFSQDGAVIDALDILRDDEVIYCSSVLISSNSLILRESPSTSPRKGTMRPPRSLIPKLTPP